MSVLEENASVVSDKKRMDILSTNLALYVEVASQVLSSPPKLCTNETMKLER